MDQIAPHTEATRAWRIERPLLLLLVILLLAALGARIEQGSEAGVAPIEVTA